MDQPAARRPARASAEGTDHLFAGEGEMAALMRATDWSRTALGPVEKWSPALRMIVRYMLPNRFPLLLWWGPEFLQLYNDAYRPVLGTKHPQYLGRSVRECWSEIWDVLEPLIETPFQGGPATWMEDIELEVNRLGYLEETHFTIGYSPVPDESVPSGIGGVLATVHEITERVVGERRVVALRDLGARSSEAKTAEEACQIAAATLALHPKDVPFALLYLLDRDGGHAHLAASTRVAFGAPISPGVVTLGGAAVAGSSAPESDDRQAWPLATAVRTESRVVVADLATRFAAVPPGPWHDPPHTAVVVPIRSNIAHQLAGLLVVGVSARLRFDDAYAGFLDLVSGQIATAIANARAYEEERRRAEALAEIDRAKTVFFSNVSHEFRTPLTLMLSPLEDVLARRDGLPSAARVELDTVYRNGLRLLKLVNTLLDFSRIEAGRARASFAPTDLAALTADLASVFRSVIEHAGLRLVVDCPSPPPDAPAAYVDRDMWEKIVLNLVSNAFKFTFEGTITVALHVRPAPRGGGTEAGTPVLPASCGPGTGVHTPSGRPQATSGGPRHWGLGGEVSAGEVVLTVADTGAGIPAAELGRLFERFHQVRGARSRSYEGSGIGLALVRELVHLHGGSIHVESAEGAGTTFTVRLPLGAAHLPSERIGAAGAPASTALGATPFVDEARGWLGAETGAGGEPAPPLGWLRAESGTAGEALSGAHGPDAGVDTGQPARLLLADDNTDMRAYLRRLLGERYEVEAVANGAQALAAALERPPDLVLSDVMMPELDGFALLRALRADPRTAAVPVILISARAGEEATLEGLEAGADDYLVKPFSAREVLSRVAARLEIARTRREALHRAHEMGAIFEAMADGVVIYDDAGNLIQWNAALAALFEFDRMPDYAGRPMATRPAQLRVRDAEGRPIPADELPFMRAAHGETLTGPHAVDLVVTVPSGREKYVSASAAPLRDAAGRIVGAVTVYRDVSERRQLEERINASLAAVMGMAEALVTTPEEAGDTEAGPARERTVRRVLALVQKVFAGQYIAAAVLDAAADTVEPLAVVGLSPEIETQWWADLRARPMSAFVAQPMFERLVAGEVLDSDLTGQPPVPGSDHFGVRRTLVAVQPLAGSSARVVAVEVHNRSASTPPERELVRAAARVVALAVERDRLAREREEARLRELALRVANERMDEFLGIASHELRTPLTALRTNLQLLERRLAAATPENADERAGAGALDTTTEDELARLLAAARRALGAAERSDERLERLVGDLVDVSRIQAGKLELRPAPADLLTIVRESVDEQRQAWPTRAITLAAPRRGAFPLVADADRVGQVVTNFLTNALKYSAADAPVAVRVGRRGGVARVAVRDQGPGLAVGQRARLFERFYRVPGIEQQSGSGVGLGLGLHICKTIVERHGGQVGVESRQGEGSTFWFTLPLAAAHDPLSLGA